MSAAERFTEHFLSIMDGLAEELYQMADQADDHELRRLYFTALQKLYGRRQELKGDFKKQFLAVIKAEIQQQSNPRLASLFANAVTSGVAQLPNTPSSTAAKPQAQKGVTNAVEQSDEDQYSRMANTLPKGSWVEFHSSDGTPLKARFTWVNPTSGVYLFVDRHGKKAPDRTPAALATAFRNGSATLVQ